MNITELTMQRVRDEWEAPLKARIAELEAELRAFVTLFPEQSGKIITRAREVLARSQSETKVAPWQRDPPHCPSCECPTSETFEAAHGKPLLPESETPAEPGYSVGYPACEHTWEQDHVLPNHEFCKCGAHRRKTTVNRGTKP